MTSFVKPASVKGAVHVSTANVDAIIDSSPYTPESLAAEADLQDLVRYGQLEVASAAAKQSEKSDKQKGEDA